MSIVGHEISDLQPAFPDRSVKEIEKILDDNRLGLRRCYESFGYLGIRQCESKFFNVKSDGSRSTGREKFEAENFCRIHSYGGSTTMGENVPDFETMSAHLEKLLYSKYNDGCLVSNFGAGNHTSLHSTLRLLFHCLLGNAPDIAIFLNGYNDLFYSGGGEDGIANLFDQLLLYSQDSSKHDVKLSDLISKIPSSARLDAEEQVDLSGKLASLRFQNISQRYGTALAIQNFIEKTFHTKIIRFIEPSAAVCCRPDQNVLPKLFNFGTRRRITNHLYRELNSFGLKAVFGKNVISLISFGQDKLEFPLFIDGVHFTPQMNQILAVKICEHIKPKWIEPKAMREPRAVNRSEVSELTNPNNYPLF